MINELYELSAAMDRANIKESIPAQNFPALAGGICICVAVKDGAVTGVRAVSQSEKEIIHKYGVTSKGFYPCVKLAPLFRICDKEAISMINKAKKHPELVDSVMHKQISSLCIENNCNWDKKVIARYNKSMNTVAKELCSFLAGSPYEPLIILAEETNRFTDPMCLYEALRKSALKAMELKVDVALALTILFACSTKTSEEKESVGDLSVLFDTERLAECDMPSVTCGRFSEDLNEALLRAETQIQVQATERRTAAFHTQYSLTEAVMPEIRLAAGFSVKLRTMNKDVPCQHRYNQEGINTYPASAEIRQRLSKALTFISKKENENNTWITIEKVEIDGKQVPRDVMFAYPLELKKVPENFACMFQKVENNQIAFESQAKQFLSALKKTRCSDADTHADGIRIFVLRRINVGNNSGRAKVVYTRQTDPYELEKQSEAWTAGCMNLPLFAFGQPNVPFPLDAADILNRFWNQKGESITDKFKPVPKYHGMELLMDSNYPVTADLHCLAEKAMAIGAFLGNKLAEGNLYYPMWDKIKDLLALTGLMLYRDGIGKDAYMESLPYLYGQLLKVSDELHALYCNAVRDGELPTQLAGGSLYQAAAEAPIRTLDMLVQRMNPYILWAKTYRTKKISEKGKESWKAGWLLSLYENIATELFTTWNNQTRFNDEEKAMLFLGYLANFPKKEQISDGTKDINNTEEANDDE